MTAIKNKTSLQNHVGNEDLLIFEEDGSDSDISELDKFSKNPGPGDRLLDF
jgi:hypothetical protein